MAFSPQLPGRHLALLREISPLVHSITNLVVMQTTANALLALGASPIMAHAREEMEDIVSLASALVLNIGTLSLPWVDSMRAALTIALARGIPVVIDPVGAGASRLRTQTALDLLREACEPAVANNAVTRPGKAVLRGNASEIIALFGKRIRSRGVDSAAASSAAGEAAAALAQAFHCCVCVSGPVDTVTDGSAFYSLTGGSPLMSKVTGMGCTASALCAAFAAVCPAKERLLGVISAMAVMSAAGTLAAQGGDGRRIAGPGSFSAAFLDRLYSLRGEDILATVRIEAVRP